MAPRCTEPRARGGRRGLVAALALCAAAGAAASDLRAALELKGQPGRGKAAFEDCTRCHRKDATGRANGAVPRLSGQHASVIVKQVADIRSGLRSNPVMKPYVEAPSMTPQALADIAAYLQSLPIAGSGTSVIGKGPGTAVAQGQAIYVRDCAMCHGERGEGRAEAFLPMLAGQHYDYLVSELVLIRDGGRGNSNPAMVERIKGFGQAEIEAVADYLTTLPLPRR